MEILEYAIVYEHFTESKDIKRKWTYIYEFMWNKFIFCVVFAWYCNSSGKYESFTALNMHFKGSYKTHSAHELLTSQEEQAILNC